MFSIGKDCAPPLDAAPRATTAVTIAMKRDSHWGGADRTRPTR
jgi:hypothetical protein